MLLIDTHVVLWWQAESSRLSVRAARAIAAEREVYVAAISCWEIGMLLAKGRIALDREPHGWLRDLEALSTVRFVDVSADAALEAGMLGAKGFVGDPADALIYATARELGARLVTKDGAMRAFARTARDVKTIW